MTTVQPEVREAKQFIGGTVDRTPDGATFEDLDPFTGDVVASVPAGGARRRARARSRPRPPRSRPGRRRRPRSGRRSS